MFTLDKKIEKTSIPVAKHGVFDCRLVRDNRYFWMLIIPETEGVEEIHDLPDEIWRELADLTRHLSGVLKTASKCNKINIAMIGNVVNTLHVHIVARNAGDEAWPHPVWGRGEAKRMTKTIRDWRIAVIKDALRGYNHG
jgi:diadenosine tetraphosphate (Ap4A) HIT family hydrolase